MVEIREDRFLKEVSDIGIPVLLLSDDDWLVDIILIELVDV